MTELLDKNVRERVIRGIDSAIYFVSAEERIENMS